MQFFNSLRALWRILQLLWVTALLVGKLTRRQNLSPSLSRVLADEFRQRWGLRALKIMGVELRVHGTPPDFPALYAANHRSYADAPAVLAALPCTFLSKAEVAKLPFIGAGAQRVGILFVQRDTQHSRSSALRALAKGIQDGRSVGLFPEGTTSDDHEMLPFHMGSFHVAATIEAPIVPVALKWEREEDGWGSSESMFRHFLRVHGRKRTGLDLYIGPPMRSKHAHELEQMVRDWIHQQLGVNPQPSTPRPSAEAGN